MKHNLLVIFSFFICSNTLLFAQKIKSVSKPKYINESIPLVVNETSGLINYNGGLWTINDSGGKPCIYKISYDGKRILQTICITNATNHDWEEISQDASFIYIGDFGNNKGQRDKLTIYKLEKSKITDQTFQIEPFETINFSYAQRKRSYEPIGNSAYDCEAMIVVDTKIWVFTKNWVDETTELYYVPNKAGDYVVPKLETFQIKGLVTAATLSDDNKTLVFLGYHDFMPFVTIVPDFNPISLSLRRAKRFDLGSIWGRQTEGIAFISNDRLAISCEEVNKTPPALFEISIMRKKPVVYIPYPDSAIEP